jgi:MFS family permease
VSSPGPETPHDPFLALREANYRRFAFSFLCSGIGLQAMNTTVLWGVWESTRDALALGWTGVARALPVVALTLVAGQAVDRLDRRKVFTTTQALFVLVSLGLGAASLLGASVASVYILLAAGGAVRAFNAPSRASMLPSLVPPDSFENAIAWNSGLFQLAAITGPLLAGGIIGWSGATWPAFATATVLLAIAAVASLGLKPRPVERDREPISMASFLAGFGHIYRERTVFAAILLDLLAVLFGGATALLPIFAEEILDVGPVGLGALRAAPFVGAGLMAAYLAFRPKIRRAGPALLWSVVTFGITMIVFGISRSFALSLVALAISGAVDNISVVVRHVLVQTRTPDRLRGRVSAVNSVFIECSNELGSFESGLVARWMGPVFSVVSGGVGTLAVTGLIAWRFPELRRLRELREQQPDLPA